MNASLFECKFEIDTRGGQCQRFVMYVVVLLHHTESDYVKVINPYPRRLESLTIHH